MGWNVTLRLLVRVACASLFLVCVGWSIASPAQEALLPSGWDRWGRRAPAPQVEVVMGMDHSLCTSVVEAFNRASTEPRQLYADPMFVPWRRGTNYRGWRQERSSLAGTQYLIADVFNSGKPVVVVKHAVASGQLDEIVREYPDIGSFFSREFEDYRAVMWDSSATRLISSWTGPRGLPTAYTPLTRLPAEKLVSPVWKNERFDDGKEINVIEYDWRTFVIAREPYREVSIVLEFAGPEHANEVCYIGPIAPLREN